ncbi:MAG: hypothetical protein QM730_05395 [Anaerolineales bacterium]
MFDYTRIDAARRLSFNERALLDACFSFGCFPASFSAEADFVIPAGYYVDEFVR